MSVPRHSSGARHAPDTVLPQHPDNPLFFIALGTILKNEAPALHADPLDRPDSDPILAQAGFCGQAAFFRQLEGVDGPAVANPTGPSSTRKKVVLRKRDAGMVKGYVNSDSFLGPEGVEVLDREGHLLNVPLAAIKGVYFVRDFEGSSEGQPDRRITRNRPRLDGLWVRMTFTDSELLEGLIANNLLDVEPPGFMVTPADLSSNNLRIFVPRTALTNVEVLGVIANGTTRRVGRRGSALSLKTSESPAQIGLFQTSGEPKS